MDADVTDFVFKAPHSCSDVSHEHAARDPALQERKRFMRENSKHVSFSFVLSLALATTATSGLILLSKNENPVGAFLTFLLVVGSVALSLTLQMLIRRMHAVVVTEFDRHKFKELGLITTNKTGNDLAKVCWPQISGYPWPWPNYLVSPQHFGSAKCVRTFIRMVLISRVLSHQTGQTATFIGNARTWLFL